jgi:hypothetical protein
MNDEKNLLFKLKTQRLSLYVMKEGKVLFKSREHRIKPLYLCLNQHGDEMKGAIVVDKLVGAAAAYLCILGKVKRVITPVISRTARNALEEADISVHAEKIIVNVMNQDKTGLCPMEKLARELQSPKAFYNHISDHIFQNE